LDLFVHGIQALALGCHSTRLRRSKLHAFGKKRKKQRSKQSLQLKLRFALIRSKAKLREANLQFSEKGIVRNKVVLCMPAFLVATSRLPAQLLPGNKPF